MGWADVGAFGGRFHETPHIDMLAASGVRFTSAYAASPVCSPTRASIMTGRNPARLRLTDWLKGGRTHPGSPILPADYADRLDPDELTLAEALKTAGYATCHVGKWHLSQRGGDGASLPENQGFDINIGGHSGGSPPSYFSPYRNPALEDGPPGEYLTTRLTSEAIAFIREHRAGPFFLYLAYYNVHIPIQPVPEKLSKYQRKAERQPPGAQDNPHYATMVEATDDNVGRILATLEELDIEDETIVFFFSDNGGLASVEGRHTPATTNAPLRAGKGFLYEGGIREPCIVRWPGVTRPGGVCDEPIISDDFFPTILEMARLDAADLPTNGPLDGVSIAPLLRDPDATLGRPALHWHYPHFSNQRGRPGAAIRIGSWKLIERYEHGRLELYDLQRDPGESTDIADDHWDRAVEMRRELRAWRRRVGANMPRPNPDYRPPLRDG